MERALLLFILVTLSGCATGDEPKPGYYGGDGSSRRPVVAVYRGDKEDRDLVAGQWLEAHYPGCFINAVYGPPGNLSSDLHIYRIKKRDGKFIEVWFKLTCLRCPVVASAALKGPNHAMQLTADRSVTTQDFMRDFSVMINFGFVSGS